MKQKTYLFIFFLAIVLLVGSTSWTGATGRSRPVPPRSPQSGRSIETIIPATAEELAAAMGVENLVSADLMGSDPAGVGIGDAPLGLTGFPTDGTTFAILSTGLAVHADTPDSSGDLTTELGGIDNNLGNDLVRLHLQLEVPSEYDCLSFDATFYSEEYPEWVGSQYNDTFTAQINNSDLFVDEDYNVFAPGNFVFDSQGNMTSINALYDISGPTATTYDGGTPRLQARTAVIPNTTVDIYLSIQDVSDSLWDSAVFLDNFFWSKDPGCADASGGTPADTDGDGLLDPWETSGMTVYVGGVPIFVDLPAMGADPMHKDVLVEIDYMADAGHSHRPHDMAIAKIVQAFNQAPVMNPDGTTGIHLHVDYGPTAPLTWGTAATWGSLSRSSAIPHAEYISTCTGTADVPTFNWAGFNAIKASHFTAERASVFHYNVWAHILCSLVAIDLPSGISRNGLDATFGDGASDFIVSLGGWSGSINQQAGAFMHELGHNLGLKHGGPDHANFKPNYLSVMNYSFQSSGLTINNIPGNFDYSRYVLAPLNETNLNETTGIGIPGAVTDLLGTKHVCGGLFRADNDARAVDWNCNGSQANTGVVMNINGEGGLTTLTTHNDWDHLVFLGGAIGRLGANIELPQEGESNELDWLTDFLINDVTDRVYLPVMIKGQ